MRINFGPDEWVDVIPVDELRMKHQDDFDDLRFSETTLTAEGRPDKEAIEKDWDGGWLAYSRWWSKRQVALVAAIVVTDWSYDAPRPAVEGGKVLNRESLGGASKKLADVLDVYMTEFERAPDPKVMEAATTTSSSSPSKARDRSPKE